ncbi:hypothetical protein BDF22DRAFT_731825 [Syncephalis plumigaleata]|nr:hypothetical protein BDF22DRAFT_731825 [Syncephalis plumigaleata]
MSDTPNDTPECDPESGHPLPRTFLPNAIEFNFTGVPGLPDEFLRALHGKYGERVRSVRRMLNSKFQLGFKPNEDLTKVLLDGFTYGSFTIPINRAYAPNAHVLCITVSDLAVTDPDGTTKALKQHFRQYGTIADIRLHYAGSTNWLEPSAAVYLDISAEPSVAKTIERCPIILGQVATLRWRNAPPLCVYCKATGHSVGGCSALRRKKDRLKAQGKSNPNPRSRKRRRQVNSSSNEQLDATTESPSAPEAPMHAVSTIDTHSQAAQQSKSNCTKSDSSSSTHRSSDKNKPPSQTKPAEDNTKKKLTAKSGSGDKPITRSVTAKNMFAALWEGAAEEQSATKPAEDPPHDWNEEMDDFEAMTEAGLMDFSE